MKKIFIALSFITAVAAQAQILNVSSIERLNVKTPGDATHALAISPQGDYLILTAKANQGLVKWDMTTGATTTITRNAVASSDVRISDDGQQVVFGEVSYKNKRRHEAVKSVDLSSGKQNTLIKPTRNLQGVALNRSTAIIVADGQIQSHALKKGTVATNERPVLSRHHLKLFITRNGETTQLAPNGADERYIWGSLSPNGSRVLYYVSGRGTFVCDIDGKNVIAMGDLTAPKWWDDNTIVGMSEVDGEHSIAASSIVARTIDGIEQVLTGDNTVATYPLPSPQAGKIAFSTPNGDIYVITVD